MQSLYNELTHPRIAKSANIEGIVQVQFIVGKDGYVINVEVI
ncbi:energy transducer TonB [Fodinibius saliphilus]